MGTRIAEPRRSLRRVALIMNSQVAPRRRMLAGVARYMHEHEPWAIYMKPFGVEMSLRDWVRDWNGDGIMAAVWDVKPEDVRGLSIPLVDLIGFLHNDKIPLVHTDDRAVGRLGAEHLIERGFRRFGFVEHPEPWSIQRREGFEQAVNRLSRDVLVFRLPHPSRRKPGPGDWEAQQRDLVEWIQALPKPIGVMASADITGQHLLEACQRASIVVPEQVAVIGADNDELICDICFPPLSSVVINDSRRGYEAAAVLDRMMSGKHASAKPVYIEPSGVVSRASTDILAIEDQQLAIALRFIREHACEQITTDDILRSVAFSRSVLERKFKKAVGRTINDEIVRLRMNRALELLTATDLELKAIAYKAGFRSASYMGAVFREKLGRTPGSYRKTSLESVESTTGPVPAA
jgi:LacI family transcriptional regulator